mmetsp:Transcript_94905/g.241320  ORF Transcript_94905/g.241320 Transcript_94905/m.241320 type:complete len:261 (-) Transcript_94905:1083-1865(-)
MRPRLEADRLCRHALVSTPSANGRQGDLRTCSVFWELGLHLCWLLRVGLLLQGGHAGVDDGREAGWREVFLDCVWWPSRPCKNTHAGEVLGRYRHHLHPRPAETLRQHRALALPGRCLRPAVWRRPLGGQPGGLRLLRHHRRRHAPASRAARGPRVRPLGGATLQAGAGQRRLRALPAADPAEHHGPLRPPQHHRGPPRRPPRRRWRRRRRRRRRRRWRRRLAAGAAAEPSCVAAGQRRSASAAVRDAALQLPLPDAGAG